MEHMGTVREYLDHFMDIWRSRKAIESPVYNDCCLFILVFNLFVCMCVYICVLDCVLDCNV